MHRLSITQLTVTLMCLTVRVVAQQVPDTLSVPQLTPTYQNGSGPVVRIDEAHYNFHTATNRFRPFAMVMERDGYKVERGRSAFSAKDLKDVDILVVSNALSERNNTEWSVPTNSAFTEQEIAELNRWVSDGGSLFLIADHMPFPGCNAKLAQSFGFTFYDGFAFDTTKRGGPDTFTASAGLVESSLTHGIPQVTTFTGQAFDVPAGATPIIRLDHKFKLWISDVAWEFDHDTRKISAAGKAQGAYMTVGKGKLVVFGEAAMFTAQLAGGRNKMGFNHPVAANNIEFLLRLMHWLDGD